MANGKNEYEANRRAAGAGEPFEDGDENNVARPGVAGGGAAFLPSTDRDSGGQSDASAAEGTVGAHGEMDITGAPAGTSGRGGPSGGSAAGQTLGGGTGGGAMASGGTGPGVTGPGPQSVESTLAVLGDNEPSTMQGGSGGASGTGGEGGSDAAGESATTGGSQ